MCSVGFSNDLEKTAHCAANEVFGFCAIDEMVAVCVCSSCFVLCTVTL